MVLLSFLLASPRKRVGDGQHGSGRSENKFSRKVAGGGDSSFVLKGGFSKSVFFVCFCLFVFCLFVCFQNVRTLEILDRLHGFMFCLSLGVALLVAQSQSIVKKDWRPTT